MRAVEGHFPQPGHLAMVVAGLAMAVVVAVTGPIKVPGPMLAKERADIRATAQTLMEQLVAIQLPLEAAVQQVAITPQSTARLVAAG